MEFVEFMEFVIAKVGVALSLGCQAAIDSINWDDPREDELQRGEEQKLPESTRSGKRPKETCLEGMFLSFLIPFCIFAPSEESEQPNFWLEDEARIHRDFRSLEVDWLRLK